MISIANKGGKLKIIIERNNKRIATSIPIKSLKRFVVVLNRQFTNAPNTTQISSGAGRSSAAGNNAAILSPNTRQQQSVGAGGRAINSAESKRHHHAHARAFSTSSPSGRSRIKRKGKEVVIVINEQIVKLPKGQTNASATQVTSGAGFYSTGGTNSAIESAGTKQQHAVGGDGVAVNKWGKRKKQKHKKRR